ncbi:MAG: class I SAM-dependent methyltransferase [Gammaproteobacteria bacterium]|nr:class I SAM-dependent methyltransferase [Gammaproteobacteria bacterium]
MAVAYGEFRPDYPHALFEHLAALAPGQELAWDCATGNGQAALPLCTRFRRVLASDASAAQLAEARRADNLALCVAGAERVPLADGSVDLVTVAQALHWFRLGEFFDEARRVLRQRGVLAVWTYHLFSVTPDIDALLRHFNREVVGPYWPPQRRMVEQAYADIEFPFAELDTRMFPMAVEWSVEHLLAYVATWSAVARYRQLRDADPMPDFARDVRAAWGDAARREVRFPLTVKTMRKA